MFPGTFRGAILLSPECLNSLRSPLLTSPSSLFPSDERLFTMLGSERLSNYMALEASVIQLLTQSTGVAFSDHYDRS
jgi:hypothetical protein